MKHYLLFLLFILPVITYAQSDSIPQKGDRAVEKYIFFDYNKAVLRSHDSATVATLDKWVNFMKKYPRIKMEVSAHSDSRGSKMYSVHLTQKRAEAIVEYMISKGVKKERLVAKGYEDHKLLNHCKGGVKCSEEEHAQNRRIEFKVLEVE